MAADDDRVESVEARRAADGARGPIPEPSAEVEVAPVENHDVAIADEAEAAGRGGGDVVIEGVDAGIDAEIGDALPAMRIARA